MEGKEGKGDKEGKEGKDSMKGKDGKKGDWWQGIDKKDRALTAPGIIGFPYSQHISETLCYHHQPQSQTTVFGTKYEGKTP